MTTAIIRGATKEQTKAFLKKAGELITDFTLTNRESGRTKDFVKFKKYNEVKGSGIQGLPFSIIRAEDGNYYALGHRKEEQHLLGKGAHSEVRIAYPLVYEIVGDHYEWTLGEEIVVKQATRKHNPKNFPNLEARQQQEFKEDNERTFKALQAHEDSKAVKATSETSEKNYLFTKLVDGREALQGVLDGSFKKDSLCKRLRFLSNITSEVVVLHEQNIVHGDIALKNVMHSPRNNVGKLIDHEFAVTAGAERVGRTAHYAAPEFVRTDRASKEADIYALGTLFWEMLVVDENTPVYVDASNYYMDGCPIFAEKNQAYRNNPRPEVLIRAPLVATISESLFAGDTESYRANLLAFLQRMTAEDPKNRPSAEEVQEFIDNFIVAYEKSVGKSQDVIALEEQGNKKGMATKPILQQILSDMKFDDYIAKFSSMQAKLSNSSDANAAITLSTCVEELAKAKESFLQNEEGTPIPAATRRLQRACLRAISKADYELKEIGYTDPNATWSTTAKNFLYDCLNTVITKLDLNRFGISFFSKAATPVSRFLDDHKKEIPGDEITKNEEDKESPSL